MKEKIFKVAIYVRLSKDDGQVGESNSITNQKDLIREYIKNMPNMTIVCEKVDDGFSGVNFDRPAFNEMMKDIEVGRINCIAVKDLSRFGRNYLDVLTFLEKFPQMGIRFISVNDGFDSETTTSDAEKNILLPFKSIINDAYIGDISTKVRSQLDIKRKKGDFIGNFTVYGYKKDDNHKNKIVIDEDVAPVVKDIFKWKIEGLSQQAIADRLNNLGILSPMEYKNSVGLKYSTNFKVKQTSKWSPVAVSRILKNNIYFGELSQGKRSSPNYKVKQKNYKPQAEWITIKDNHKPIIPENDFLIANGLLKRDTRTAPNEETVYLFSGKLFCADCERSMIRKIVPSHGKKYVYYVCKMNHFQKTCTSHSIAEGNLSEAVLFTIRKHIESVIELEKALKFIEDLPVKADEVQKFSSQIIMQKKELERNQKYLLFAYEKFADNTIDKEEFIYIKEKYTLRCEEIEDTIAILEGEIEANLLNSGSESIWIQEFKKHQNIVELTRVAIVNLIDKIIIYEGSRIEIVFYHSNKQRSVQEFVNSVLSSTSGVV